VSGKLQGQTETATLFVENQFHQFNLTGAYAASFVLAMLAIGTLLSMNLMNKRRGRRAA
jgi:ABC-type sulfate transport system permease subunit